MGLKTPTCTLTRARSNHVDELLPQNMLADVWTKFRFFQKPANFDTRLAECERVLAGVKGQVGLLGIRSVEQDVVQSQLEQCMVGNGVTCRAHRFTEPPDVRCCPSNRNCTRC